MELKARTCTCVICLAPVIVQTKLGGSVMCVCS